MLRSFVQQNNHRTWEDNLSAVGCAIRTSRQETTGYTPYLVNFSMKHKLFGHDYSQGILTVESERRNYARERINGFKQLYHTVKKRIESSQLRNRHNYNLRRRLVSFLPGQKV